MSTLSTAAVPQKTCVLCGLDVSSQKRIKDSRGHYFCAACWTIAQKRRQSEPAAPSSPSGGGQGEEVSIRIAEEKQRTMRETTSKNLVEDDDDSIPLAPLEPPKFIGRSPRPNPPPIPRFTNA